jgi:hypothetical protein
MLFNDLFVELTRVLSRVVTGRLLTDEQIRSVTGTVVGRYFADWFPRSQEEVEAQKRVERALHHIGEANRIIGGLKDDLDAQAEQLEQFSKEIDEKRQTAERYAAMAATNQQAVAAFRAELEDALRRELSGQANKGKRLRQVASFIVWILTLVLGAALGAYFPEIVAWLRGSAV